MPADRIIAAVRSLLAPARGAAVSVTGPAGSGGLLACVRGAAFALLVVLGGCAVEAPELKPTRDPAGAVMAFVGAMRQADVALALRVQLPPDDLRRLREAWQRGQDIPATDAERASFAQSIALLTGKGAEKSLETLYEAKVVRNQAELRTQIPMWSHLLEGMLVSSVRMRADLSDPEKDAVANGISALARWFGRIDPGDREAARRAIEVLCATARDLKLESLDQVRDMDLDVALARAGIAVRGFKRMLAAYGLDLDQALDTVRVEDVVEDGDEARVRVRYELFGEPQTAQWRLVRVDGRWYGRQTLGVMRNQLEASLGGSGATTTEPPAPAGPESPADDEPVESEPVESLR